MDCAPSGSVLVVRVATPEAFKVAEPRFAEPFLKATEPVGVPETEAETVAVNVTELPTRAGSALAVKMVIVFSCTVCVRTPEVPGKLNASPL